jgi:hypothetical protein
VKPLPSRAFGENPPLKANSVKTHFGENPLW